MSLIPQGLVPMSCLAGSMTSQALEILRDEDNKIPESPENQIQSHHPDRVWGYSRRLCGWLEYLEWGSTEESLFLGLFRSKWHTERVLKSLLYSLSTPSSHQIKETTPLWEGNTSYLRPPGWQSDT